MKRKRAMAAGMPVGSAEAMEIAGELLCLAEGLLLLGAMGSARAGEPRWVAPPAESADARRAAFTGSLEVGGEFDRALARVSAHERYRLFVNGAGVSAADTPWDAETYDIARLLRRGPNEVRVEVAADPPEMPKNAWVVLERRLPKPVRAGRLRFCTSGAKRNEWLYVEVLDAGNNTSGYYCLERGRRDFMLGTTGEAREHSLDLAAEPRLEHRPTRPCDFARIAALRVRVDRKDTTSVPAGEVRFSDIAIKGEETLDLSDAAGWRIVPGHGEHRRSRVEAAEGGFTLRYNFQPAAAARLALDVRAWKGKEEVASLASGPSLAVEGKPSLPVEGLARDPFTWIDAALHGPDDRTDAPTAAAATLRFEGGVDRLPAGAPVKARARVWALAPDPGGKVRVEVESWQGKRVFTGEAAIAWSGAEGEAEIELPALPRGLYRVRASTGAGASGPVRSAALALLGPGEKRVSAIFDTLTPLPSRPGFQGVDLSYSDSAALLLGIRDLGVSFLQVHLGPSQLDNGELEELLAFCRATRLRFAFNNESANWGPAAPAPDGRNRFDAPGGCHRWDLEPEALRKAAATGLFEGVVYDEGEHMQLCRNFYSKLPDTPRRKPYLVETDGMSLLRAYEAFLTAAQGVVKHHRKHAEAPGSPGRMIVESVFPVLWHPFARAGARLCPKLLKEDLHPVVLAQALGAAKQYGAELWLTPDLWYLDRFPGHSVASYAAALRLAHAAGVDCVYSEYFTGFCRTRGPVYDLTAYGQALRDFITRWRPGHPRAYTYRDYEPEVAILRFPDSDSGQSSGRYWNALYGAENLLSTPETREWLQVWHLLTGGATHPGAVNTNSGVYPRDTWQFTYPSPPTAVYDHLVGDTPLAGVSTLFLCGVTLSDGTLDAVRRRVRAGATCFTPARLSPPDVRAAASKLPAKAPDGKGSWIVVPGYRPEDLGAFAGLVPKAGNSMRLRFRGKVISMPSN